MNCFKATIYEWPESQKCGECAFGEPCVWGHRLLEGMPSNAHLCTLACDKNTGTYCPEFQYPEEE